MTYNSAWLGGVDPLDDRPKSRRQWLWAAVVGSLITTFGTLTSYAIAYLLPARHGKRAQRVFLGFASSFAPGHSRVFELPSGDQLVVACTASAESGNGLVFRGYSDRCPHLGCRVHYVAAVDQYHCPCHAGVFTADGEGISGPPGQAGQWLRRYQMELDGNSLYVTVDVG